MIGLLSKRGALRQRPSFWFLYPPHDIGINSINKKRRTPGKTSVYKFDLLFAVMIRGVFCLVRKLVFAEDFVEQRGFGLADVDV